MSRAMLAASYAALGRADDAGAEVQEILKRSPEYTLAYIPKVMPYKDPKDLDHVIEFLRKAGLPEE